MKNLLFLIGLIISTISCTEEEISPVSHGNELSLNADAEQVVDIQRNGLISGISGLDGCYIMPVNGLRTFLESYPYPYEFYQVVRLSESDGKLTTKHSSSNHFSSSISHSYGFTEIRTRDGIVFITKKKLSYFGYDYQGTLIDKAGVHHRLMEVSADLAYKKSKLTFWHDTGWPVFLESVDCNNIPTKGERIFITLSIKP